MEPIENNKSLAIACISCERVIALLAMTNNPKANWDGLQHKSDIDISITMCKNCEYEHSVNDYTSVTVGDFITKKTIKRTSIFRKVHVCTTGRINIIGSKKRIPIVNVYSMFTMSPNKYCMVSLTGARAWPTDRTIPGDFI